MMSMETADLSLTSYVILGLLNTQEISGYDVQQRLRKDLAAIYTPPAKSLIYSALRHLEASNFATSVQVLQTHRPHKRLYRITPQGRAALRSWLTTPPQEAEVVRHPWLLRLFFGALVPPEVLLGHLAAVRQQCEKEVKRCETQLQAQSDAAAADLSGLVSQLIVQEMLAHHRATLTWIDQVVITLQPPSSKAKAPRRPPKAALREAS